MKSEALKKIQETCQYVNENKDCIDPHEELIFVAVINKGEKENEMGYTQLIHGSANSLCDMFYNLLKAEPDTIEIFQEAVKRVAV